MEGRGREGMGGDGRGGERRHMRLVALPATHGFLPLPPQTEANTDIHLQSLQKGTITDSAMVTTYHHRTSLLRTL